MSNSLIRRAFESRVADWAAAKNLPVVYENVNFGATSGAYVQCNLLPNNTQSEDLQGLHRHYLGIFQVSLVLLPGNGMGQAEAFVSELDALFPTTFPMDVSGLKVWITRPMSSAPASPEPDKLFIPVSCSYEAHTI